jgi:endonuclease/exonuclease/phosphatase (EEP) superfamily protein YafD
MVTFREWVDELLRVLSTCLSWVIGFVVALYLVLRVLVGDGFWALALFNNFAYYCFLPLVCLVPLGLITRAKWGLVATVPIAIIGLIWFGPYFISKSVGPVEGKTIKVVTFNWYRSNFQLEQVANWLSDQDADLVVLQEVPAYYGGLLSHRFRDVYPYTGVQIRSGMWGNFFLSRYAVLNTEFLTPADDPVPNTQQRFEVDVDGVRLAVYNIDVALSAGEARFELPLVDGYIADYATGYDDTLRNAHIQRILDRVSHETLPYILAGDFNLSEQAVFYGVLAGTMHDTFREVGAGMGATWPVAHVNGLPPFIPTLLRVDYIWHSAGLRALVAETGPTLGSDHLPVYAELEIVAD